MAAQYKMGAVVHLTGIPANTLRTWERRYSAVEPHRTDGGARLYTDDDVTRLQLLSALTELGESIGTIADLPADALRDRLAVHGGARLAQGKVDPDDVPMVVLGEAVHAQLTASANDGVNLVHPEPLTLQQVVSGRHPARAVVAELDALGDAPVHAFEALMNATGASVGFVVVSFAPKSLLWRLSDVGARLWTGPLQVHSLVQRVREQLALPPRPARERMVRAPDGASAERVFSEAQLGRMREVRSSIECECPNHLAALVQSLNAFEDYSRACVSRDADDAALHGELAAGTAAARQILETLLQQVVERDNLEF